MVIYYSVKCESNDGAGYVDSDTGLSLKDMIELVRENMKSK